MKLEVATKILETFDREIPDSIDAAAAVALRQDGARAVLEEVLDWEPLEVTDEA